MTDQCPECEKARQRNYGGRLQGAIVALEMCKQLITPRDWPRYAESVLEHHQKTKANGD